MERTYAEVAAHSRSSRASIEQGVYNTMALTPEIRRTCNHHGIGAAPALSNSRPATGSAALRSSSSMSGRPATQQAAMQQSPAAAGQAHGSCRGNMAACMQSSSGASSSCQGDCSTGISRPHSRLQVTHQNIHAHYCPAAANAGQLGLPQQQPSAVAMNSSSRCERQSSIERRLAASQLQRPGSRLGHHAELASSGGASNTSSCRPVSVLGAGQHSSNNGAAAADCAAAAAANAAGLSGQSQQQQQASAAYGYASRQHSSRGASINGSRRLDSLGTPSSAHGSSNSSFRGSSSSRPGSGSSMQHSMMHLVSVGQQQGGPGDLSSSQQQHMQPARCANPLYANISSAAALLAGTQVPSASIPCSSSSGRAAAAQLKQVPAAAAAAVSTAASGGNRHSPMTTPRGIKASGSYAAAAAAAAAASTSGGGAAGCNAVGLEPPAMQQGASTSSTNSCSARPCSSSGKTGGIGGADFAAVRSPRQQMGLCGQSNLQPNTSATGGAIAAPTVVGRSQQAASRQNAKPPSGTVRPASSSGSSMQQQQQIWQQCRLNGPGPPAGALSQDPASPAMPTLAAYLGTSSHSKSLVPGNSNSNSSSSSSRPSSAVRRSTTSAAAGGAVGGLAPLTPRGASRRQQQQQQQGSPYAATASAASVLGNSPRRPSSSSNRRPGSTAKAAAATTNQGQQQQSVEAAGPLLSDYFRPPSAAAPGSIGLFGLPGMEPPGGLLSSVVPSIRVPSVHTSWDASAAGLLSSSSSFGGPVQAGGSSPDRPEWAQQQCVEPGTGAVHVSNKNQQYQHAQMQAQQQQASACSGVGASAADCGSWEPQPGRPGSRAQPAAAAEGMQQQGAGRQQQQLLLWSAAHEIDGRPVTRNAGRERPQSRAGACM